ncbi:UNVERIFIED_ORG: hypothetical protein J2W87_004299 [Pseudomonas putida]|nr:hypothetical protein [Pseudomonas putida]
MQPSEFVRKDLLRLRFLGICEEANLPCVM